MPQSKVRREDIIAFTHQIDEVSVHPAVAPVNYNKIVATHPTTGEIYFIDMPSGGFTVADNLLDLNVTSGILTAAPYTAKSTPDPGYPYFYRATALPSFVNNELKLDGSLVVNNLSVVNSDEAITYTDVSPVSNSWVTGTGWTNNGDGTYTHTSVSGGVHDLTNTINVPSGAMYIIDVSTTGSFTGSFGFTMGVLSQPLLANNTIRISGFNVTTTGTTTITITCNYSSVGTITNIKIYRVTKPVNNVFKLYSTTGVERFGVKQIGAELGIGLNALANKMLYNSSNTAIGTDALRYAASVSNSTVVGYGSCANLGYGTSITTLGHNILPSLKVGINTIAIGSSFGNAITSSNANVFITSGVNGLISPAQNVVVGFGNCTATTSLSDSTIVGTSLGLSATNITRSTLLGYYLGNTTTSISNAILIGAVSASSMTSGLNNSILIGNSIVPNVTTAVNYATIVGHSAGTYVSGAYPVLYGYACGTGGGATTTTLSGVTSSNTIYSFVADNYIVSIGNSTGKAISSLTLTNCTAIGGGTAIYKTQSTLIGNYRVEAIELRGDMKLFNMNTLGSNILNNPTFTSGTNWSTTGDCSLSENKVKIILNTGSGTLSQSTSAFLSPLKVNRWYKLSISLTTENYDYPESFITTITLHSGVSAFNLEIAITVGSGYINRNYYFRTTTSIPTDFILTFNPISNNVGPITGLLTSLTLEEVLGGDLFINKDFKQRLGQYHYHLQNEDQITVGDWRTYFDATGQHIETCTSISPETWT